MKNTTNRCMLSDRGRLILLLSEVATPFVLELAYDFINPNRSLDPEQIALDC